MDAPIVKPLFECVPAFAFDQFNGNHFDREVMYEHGCLLWTDMDGNLLIPQGLFREPTPEGNIDLYRSGGGIDEIAKSSVRERDCTLTWKTKRFVGDYHTHPRYPDWIRQMPSPEDATIISVATDLWELRTPQDNCGYIRLLPVIQVVQSGLFGDVFLFEAVQRTPFATLDEQQQFCDRAYVDYRLWYDTKGEEWGYLPDVVQRADFRCKAREAVAMLNQVLGGRATVKFVENTANLSQEVDVGSGIEGI